MFRRAAIWTTDALLQVLVLATFGVLVFVGSAAPRGELVAILGGLLVLLGIHIGLFRIEIQQLWADRLGMPNTLLRRSPRDRRGGRHCWDLESSVFKTACGGLLRRPGWVDSRP